jgi:hypothetical protein
VVEAEDDYSPPIYITGQQTDVTRVKEALEKLATLKVFYCILYLYIFIILIFVMLG